MNRFLRLEFSRYKRCVFHFGIAAGISLLAALYFFGLIGRIDVANHLGDCCRYDAVIPLALTIAFCVIVIYGAVIYARLVVSDYIGNRRVLLYSYPGGRRPLFLAKNTAYLLAIGSSTVASLLIGLVIYLIIESIAPVISAKITIGDWLAAFSMAVCVSLLSMSVILIVGFVGVRRRSTMSTIIASLIMITLLGNVIAISLTGLPWLPWVIAAAGIVVSLGLVTVQSRAICTDEIL